MFVKGAPAMKIKGCLVVADLHLGITRELREYGFIVPGQVEALAARINRLLKKTKSKRLVIAGDLKHRVPGISFQEMKEIPEFLSLIHAKTTVIKGNHDTWLEELGIKTKPSVVIGNYLITHGHRNVKTSRKNIIIGHNHPAIKFRDKMGATYTEPAWIHGYGNKNIIIMPAFNELAGGHAVNESMSLMGPIARRMDIKNARAFLLDGTDLGNVKNLCLHSQ